MLIVVLWFAFAILTGFVASKKGRNSTPWYIVGLFGGPFAFLAALLISPFSPSTHKICPDCSEFVLMDAKVCKHCGCKFKAEVAEPPDVKSA